MNKITVLGIFVTSIFIMFFAVYGVFATYRIPEKKAEIQHLQDRIKELETTIDQYKSAINFEKLFLLVAKPDSISLLGDLENYIRDKADFCLEDANDLPKPER